MLTSINDCATLHNGVKIPWLGFGVFKVPDGETVVDAVRSALDVGYRSFDATAMYKNERGIGEALRASGIARDELFITTKLWNSDQGFESTLAACDKSLERLGLDYLDLYLVHWPAKGKFIDSWHAMEKLYADGKVRAIGVSNFLEHHLETIFEDCTVSLMLNQVEFHPWLVQPALRAFCKKRRVQFQSWSPLMRGKVTEVPELSEVGEKYQKTATQIVLRWNLQHEVVAIPKSVQPQRIRENADLFDFSLSEQEMQKIDGLDKNERCGQHPDSFHFDPALAP